MRIAGSIGFAIALLSCACASRGSTSAANPEPWHAFRLNPELNAVVHRDDGLAVRWTYKTGAGISSSPTISGDTVFVAGNDRRLYAFDLHTGRTRWIFVADNQLMTAPLVVGDVVIVGEGDNYGTMYDPPNYATVGKGPSGIFGIDERTGRERWHYNVPGSAMPTGAVIDGAYVEHDAGGMVFALDAASGKYRWREYLRSTAAMSAANNFRGSDVVTAGDFPNDVIDFDGRTGRVIWRTPFPHDAAAFADCPQASDGRFVYGMYLARPPDSPYSFTGYTTPGIERAYAIDGANGKIVWDTPLARGILPINNHAAIPMIDGGTMYLGSSIVPYVFALDARTGRERWRVRVAGPVKGGLVATGGRVYFGDLGGYLWSLDARTGAVRGKRKMKDGFNVGSPIIVGRTLIVGGNKGYVFALPLASFDLSQHRSSR